MGLVVWLPLTKDLRNQGLANVTVTNYGATLDNNGKLGKCYYFDGTDDRITVSGLSLPNVWSYSCWIYSATSSRSWEAVIMLNSTGGDSDLQLGFYTYPGGNRIQNTANGQYNSGIAWTYGMWHHFCGTFDGSNLKTYIDGILINTKAITASLLSRTNLTIGARSTNAANTTANTFFQGRLNDVRIYDHCLSSMEVKELAKGLVLHYPLNRQGWGQENLYTGSRDFSGTWVNGSAWTTSTETYEGFTVKERSATWGGLAQNVTATNGDIFTISFYAKVASGGRIVSIHRSNLGNVTTGLSILGGNFIAGTTDWVGTTTDGTQWNRYWATVQIVSSDITYLQWRIENSVADKKLQVCGMKLEKGSIATPWCPNSSDTLAATMGLNSTTEYDCSGFCNNGTKVGTLGWSSNTPKYNVNTEFAGSTSIYVQMPTITLDWSKVSFAAWGRWDAFNSWSRIFDFGNGASGADWDICLANYSTNANPGLGGRTGGGASWPDTRVTEVTLTAGQWYHFVETIEGTTCKLYVNGELKKTITLTNSPTVTTMNRNYLGLSNWSGNGPLKGGISDFRLYATALSADDVKSLYQNSAYIDSSGNVYGAVHSEA